MELLRMLLAAGYRGKMHHPRDTRDEPIEAHSPLQLTWEDGDPFNSQTL